MAEHNDSVTRRRVQLSSSTASSAKQSEVNRANAFARRARRSASSALHAQLQNL